MDENSDIIDSTSNSAEPESNTADEADEFEYIPDHAVLHRIVDIKDTGNSQTLLSTQGDANPYLDQYPVTADAYIGKMLWHMNYIGEWIKMLYENFDLIVGTTVILSALTTLLHRSVRLTNR